MADLLGGQFIAGTVPGVDSDFTWARVPIGIPAARMREDELLEWVYHLSSLYGVDCFHELSSRRQPLKGWPDCVLVGNGPVLWRELKSAHGTLTPEQRHFGAKLQKIGENWQVWRPAELFSGLIEAQIAGIA